MIIHKRVEGLAGERARLPIVFLIACPTVTRLVHVQLRTQPQAILVSVGASYLACVADARAHQALAMSPQVVPHLHITVDRPPKTARAIV